MKGPLFIWSSWLLFAENDLAGQEQVFQEINDACLQLPLLRTLEPWKLPRHGSCSHLQFWFLGANLEFGPKSPNVLFTVSSRGIRGSHVNECPWLVINTLEFLKWICVLGSLLILGYFDLVRIGTFYYFLSEEGLWQCFIYVYNEFNNLKLLWWV